MSVVNGDGNDAPRVACAVDGPVGSARLPAVTASRELTPRGLELLETLNELFDAMAGPVSVAGGPSCQPGADRPPARGN